MLSFRRRRDRHAGSRDGRVGSALPRPPRSTSSPAVASRSSRFRLDVTDVIAESWNAREPALAGRFDLAYDGSRPPKLLEYNADTPTALLEASVVQWHWLQGAIVPELAAGGSVQFAARKADRQLARDRRHDLGQRAGAFRLRQGKRRGLRDYRIPPRRRNAGRREHALCPYRGHRLGGSRRIRRCRRRGDRHAVQALSLGMAVKRRVRGPFAAERRIRMLEPAWKMLLSNKGFLPILWELYPGPSQPSAGLVRAGSHPGRLRPEAAAFAGRLQRAVHRDGKCGAGGRLRHGRLDLPGVSPISRASTTITLPSARGSLETSPPASGCARTRARSRATRAASFRIISLDCGGLGSRRSPTRGA